MNIPNLLNCRVTIVIKNRLEIPGKVWKFDDDGYYYVDGLCGAIRFRPDEIVSTTSEEIEVQHGIKKHNRYIIEIELKEEIKC